jgi:hypothetical protein
LKGTQATCLERIKYKPIRLAVGHIKCAPTKVILAQARIPPLEMRFKLLGNIDMSRIYTLSNHPLFTSITQLANTRSNPTWIHIEQEPLILTCYKEIESVSHLIACSDKPLIYRYPYRTTFLHVQVSFNEGREAS